MAPEPRISLEPGARDRFHAVSDESRTDASHSGTSQTGTSRINQVSARSTIPYAPTRRRRAWRPIVLVLIVIAGAGAGAWWKYLRPRDAAAAHWTTAPVTIGDVEDSVTALGNLQPKNYVDVGAQVSGQLTSIDVQIGQKVKAGDLLAEIDPTLQQAKVTADEAALANLQAQILDKGAQLDLAKQQLTRQQNMMKEDATSEDALQVAEAAARSNKAQIAALEAQAKQAQSALAFDQANLGYTKIYAPISGTVVALNARQGQTLNATQVAPVILRIADLSTMTVWTQVSEADVPRLKLGMDAYFTTLGDPSRRWTGKLRQILPTPDVVNNVVLYPALFDVANPDGTLMTEMSAQVFFVVTAVKNVVTVPVAALRDGRVSGSRAEQARADGKMAATPVSATVPPPPPAASADGAKRRPYEVHMLGPDGHPVRRRVWIGVSNRVTAQVLSGLKPGDTVIIGRQASEADGETADTGKHGYRIGQGHTGLGRKL
jgi:macrolide-specific efflux system membrane fusion protein